MTAARTISRRGGFTLIELLVVVAIVATLVALAMPATRKLTQNNGRGQAVTLARAMIGQARATAISQRRMAGVVFFEETAANSRPANGGAVAAQIFVEDFDQQRHNPKAGMTVFVELSAERQYLPAGIAVGALNDDAKRGVMTGDTTTGGNTRVILFDAAGQLILRHGIGRAAATAGAAAGTYPKAAIDWLFPSPRGTVSEGVSTPGLFFYDAGEYRQAAIPTGAAGNAARAQWIRNHSDVVIVNAYTGGVMQ
jgi:prepilin-type N-terminal cleavage/methylation domain-containing protein